jgi:hypothetical protein
MKNSEENNLKRAKVVMVLIGELILGLFTFYFYPFVSMIFLGEGINSLLYSNGNRIAWALMPILVPTLINTRNIYSAKKNKNYNKLKVFKLIQLILVVLYLPFVIWKYLTFGFHM